MLKINILRTIRINIRIDRYIPIYPFLFPDLIDVIEKKIVRIEIDKLTNILSKIAINPRIPKIDAYIQSFLKLKIGFDILISINV